MKMTVEEIQTRLDQLGTMTPQKISVEGLSINSRLTPHSVEYVTITPDLSA